MHRIILFLVLIALAAAGAAWIADQSGDVALSWGVWRIHTSLPVFVLALGVVIVAAMLAWSILRGLWRTPERVRRARRERRHARGRHAITQGLLAVGHGDSSAARAHADVARRHAANDPLALLLHAQTAQLDGDREGAQRAFRAMAERKDTRLLGLRGLFIEAQRADDSARGDGDRRRGAETFAGIDLGVAGGAGISLRQGRLDRRAGDPRQQPRIGPGRQGRVAAAARRAADGARAGTGKPRSRPVARDHHGSGKAGADAGAGRGAGEQIPERGASDPAFDAAGGGGMAGAAASRSRRRLRACKTRRFGAAAAGARRNAGRKGARPYRGRAGGGPRRHRRHPNLRARARCSRLISRTRPSASRC